MSTNIDIGQILEALNTKADMDLGNSINYLTTAAKSYFAGIGMPSNRYVDLVLNATDTEYTAPANGYFLFCKEAGATEKYMNIIRASDNFSTEANPNKSTNWGRIWLPVRKNDIVTVGYNTTGETKFFRFYYTEGDT